MRKGNIVRSKRTQQVGLIVDKRKEKRDVFGVTGIVTVDVLIDGRIYQIRARKAYKIFEVINESR